MGKKRILWASGAMIMISSVVAAVALKAHTSLEQSPSNARAVKNVSEGIIRPFQTARIAAFTRWPVGDSENDGLLCLAREFDQDPNYEGTGVKFSVFDRTGAILYEDYFTDMHRIYSSYALRQSSPQLILEVGYGGSTSFLKILDYKHGKVVNLMDKMKLGGDFTVSAEVRPQFRSGINPAIEPDQILLTQGVGLASSAEKRTEVFRYMNGAYRYVGEFLQRKVDDYIEELMKHPQSQSKTKKRS